MSVSVQETLFQMRGWRRHILQGVIVLAALGLMAASLAMAVGLLPWPSLDLRLAINL